MIVGVGTSALRAVHSSQYTPYGTMMDAYCTPPLSPGPRADDTQDFFTNFGHEDRENKPAYQKLAQRRGGIASNLLELGQMTMAAAKIPHSKMRDYQYQCHELDCQRVVINVSGQRFETQLRTLNRFPETLLGDPEKRRRYWDSRRNEYFFDRHRPSFQAILYYYQSGGRLRRPIEVPEQIFMDELEFYQLSDAVIQEYKNKEGYMIEEKKALPKSAWQRRLWLLCEEPSSSRWAKVFAIISVLCILVSIVFFCAETLPKLQPRTCLNSTFDGGRTYQLWPDYREPFFVVESLCVGWFTLEFVCRFISSPSKVAFCRSPMNAFDMIAVLPYFVSLIALAVTKQCSTEKTLDSFIIVRALRVFRVLKLSKHSQSLRILGLTIHSSMHELGMFFFFLIVAMVIFSSAAYYAESGQKNSQLTSIPGAFWWAVVTMTTVGYGDITPVGVWGKLVGTLCVLAGVLTIALPVPVVVANFNNFYRHDSGRGYFSA